jgi:hypothetical protein
MPPADNASDGLRRVTGVDVERPVISPVDHDSGGQSAAPPAPPASQPKRLLDINGLLELARLIEKFGKDAHLNSEGEGRPGPEGIHHRPRPKG